MFPNAPATSGPVDALLTTLGMPATDRGAAPNRDPDYNFKLKLTSIGGMKMPANLEVGDWRAVELEALVGAFGL